jgi:uncharacterized membrane protein
MAFFIYISDLILALNALKNSFSEKNYFNKGIYFFLIFLIAIALCMTVSVIQSICKDEYLKKHFTYQTNSLLIYILAPIIFSTLILRLASIFIDRHTLDSYIHCTEILLSVIVGIWFFYRNIKGIIYLIVDKDLKKN